MINKVKRYIKNLFKKNRLNFEYKSYNNLYKRIIDKNNINVKEQVLNEKIWSKKWDSYGIKYSPLSYKIFTKYIGVNDINIIPLEICAGIVEPILTPELYRAYYNDKNSYDSLFSEFLMPETLIRNINGTYFDKNYKILTNIDESLVYIAKFYEKIIVKPTREASGRGVQLFNNVNGKFINKEGYTLDKSYLSDNYKSNYIIQDIVKQSSFGSQFNESSLNTIRVVTYRSVMTGKTHVINSIMRIGAKGNCIDNAHGGGMFVGIDKNGKIGKYACNWLGEKKSIFNNIDFENNEYIIPKFKDICQFAIDLSDKIIHHNLIAFDIALNEKEQPILIESNIGGFSAWLFQFTNGSAFGKYTDEIMEYCIKNYTSLKSTNILE